MINKFLNRFFLLFGCNYLPVSFHEKHIVHTTDKMDRYIISLKYPLNCDEEITPEILSLNFKYDDSSPEYITLYFKYRREIFLEVQSHWRGFKYKLYDFNTHKVSKVEYKNGYIYLIFESPYG